MPKKAAIIVNALRIEQRKDIPVYVFGVEGRLVHQLATVSYANRTEDGALVGYQRAKVTTHINDILSYLSQGTPLLPNAIVVAFDDRIKFAPLNGNLRSEWGTFGKLEIPLPKNFAETKAGWIVDGQQRVTALSKLKPGAAFPVVVIGFQSSSPTIQREQFLLVNKTKPLPRDLLNEILPEVTSPLSKDLTFKQVSSKVVTLLRFSKESPFYQRIRGLGAESDTHNISQASLLSVIQTSIRKKGALFDYVNSKDNHFDTKGMARVVSVFFEGVRRTWPDAWEGNPKTSRLVHGVGIFALGHLMDRIMQEVDIESVKSTSMVANRLERLRRRCAWTSGRWPVLNCAWNELQNTSQDKTRLTEYLLKEYRRKP